MYEKPLMSGSMIIVYIDVVLSFMYFLLSVLPVNIVYVRFVCLYVLHNKQILFMPTFIIIIFVLNKILILLFTNVLNTN